MSDTKFFFKKKDNEIDFEELKKEMMKIINDKFESLNNRISANENVMIRQIVQMRKDFTKSENDRERYNMHWAFHFGKTVKDIEKKLDFHKSLIDDDNERIEDLEKYFEYTDSASDHSDADKVNIDSASDHSNADKVNIDSASDHSDAENSKKLKW